MAKQETKIEKKLNNSNNNNNKIKLFKKNQVRQQLIMKNNSFNCMKFNPNNPPLLTIEYQLSRNFMDYTRNQLLLKQIQNMKSSNSLIDKLISIATKKNIDNSQKDESNLTSHNTNDTLVNSQDEQPKIRQRQFTRKNINTKKNHSDLYDQLQDVLEDIKDNCLNKTYWVIRNLIQKYNRMLKSIDQTRPIRRQNSSKNLLSKNKYQVQVNFNNNDQAIMQLISQLRLAGKNMKLQKQNLSLNTKIRELQQKLSTSCKKPPNPQVHENLHTLKQHLDIRQKRLQDFTIKIDHIHKQFINQLQTHLIDSGCNKCCPLMKKIKSSIINYKQCLIDQIQFYKELWKKLQSNHQSNISYNHTLIKC